MNEPKKPDESKPMAAAPGAKIMRVLVVVAAAAVIGAIVGVMGAIVGTSLSPKPNTCFSEATPDFLNCGFGSYP
jgi:hypothetical protein